MSGRKFAGKRAPRARCKGCREMYAKAFLDEQGYCSAKCREATP